MKKKLITLQELTDELQTLCHNGHAQKTVVLLMYRNGQPYLSIPYKNDKSLITLEESVCINFGKF